jgi:beta-xylosidase
LEKTSPLLLAALLFLTALHLQAIPIVGDTHSHDPSRMILCDGKYYVYSTFGGMKYSTDRINWTTGVSPFQDRQPPASVKTLFPENQGIWAPDVIFFNDKYYLYYSVASKDGTRCATGLITSPTLDPNASNYAWTDVGLVITEDDKVVHRSAIDPCPIVDPDGKFWLTFGSGYANGTPPIGPTIFLVQLDPATGLLLNPDNPTLYPLANGHIEASYMYFHAGYYYLFWNSGGCCSGAKSTYEIHMARSATITGPYVGKSGEPGGTSFLKSHDSIHGPGHMGILSLPEGDFFTYHYYPDEGGSLLGLGTLTWDSDGWPTPGPDPVTAN